MCSLAASSVTRASMFCSRAQLQRRGDVVGHGHRRVVDELLVDHRDVALAHRLAGHVLTVGEHPPGGRRVEPGHHAHQRGLAGLRRAEQDGDGLRHQRQVERVQRRLGARPAARCVRASAPCALRSRAGVAGGAQCAAHQARPPSRCGGAQMQAELACGATARRRRCAPIRARAGSAARPRSRPGATSAPSPSARSSVPTREP